MGPPREIKPLKETPPPKLKLLVKSMLVLLPALMQSDKPQLKGSYLPQGRSALPALGVTVQQSRGSPRPQVLPTEEWPQSPHLANGGVLEKLLPPPLVRPNRTQVAKQEKWRRDTNTAGRGSPENREGSGGGIQGPGRGTSEWKAQDLNWGCRSACDGEDSQELLEGVGRGQTATDPIWDLEEKQGRN